MRRFLLAALLLLYPASALAGWGESAAPSIRTATASPLSGTGTTQSGATPITTNVVLITSCTPTNNAFVLPAGAAPGQTRDVYIINRSTGTCVFFPYPGGTIEPYGTGAAANAAISVGSGSDASLRSTSPTSWFE